MKLSKNQTGKQPKQNTKLKAISLLIVTFLSLSSLIIKTNAIAFNSLDHQQIPGTNSSRELIRHTRSLVELSNTYLDQVQPAALQSTQTDPPPATNGEASTSTASAELPDFQEPIGNHTVALGRDAQLSCKINRLANFRTAWLRVEDKGILTIHNNIITRNYRIGLINIQDGKEFVLTIKNVQASDKVNIYTQTREFTLYLTN